MSRALTVALLSLLLACGASPEAHLDKARGHLAGGAWDQAVAASEQGIAATKDDAMSWRLELVALEAEARGGKTEPVLARLTRLAEKRSAQVQCSLYVQTAGQLQEGGDGAGAVRVLDLGNKRCPEDAAIAKAIEQAKASGDDATNEQLRSLGYLD